MKKNIFGPKKFWIIKNLDKKMFWGSNMYQAKSGVISFSVWGWGVPGSKNQSGSEWPETCLGF